MTEGTHIEADKKTSLIKITQKLTQPNRYATPYSENRYREKMNITDIFPKDLFRFWQKAIKDTKEGY